MDDQGERVRIRSGRRFLLGVFVALFVLAVIALVAGLLVARGGSSVLFEEGEPPVWARILGLVLPGLGVIVEVAVLVWAVRSGRYRVGRQSPLWAVSWRRRRELAGQVRRGSVGSDAGLPLLQASARHMANSGGSPCSSRGW
ncbi:hypothetical protein OG799_30705 [Micromonospora sp. NBC_00898]|uniref:hypothetical protein n=1 Tax=Micromonospora sp. NBC_00898 TaxID=2975981 RepID=UPI00386EB07A|nr:hypothetical protein OG799_30705 [Micromonospora sp. NBC_00898]